MFILYFIQPSLLLVKTSTQNITKIATIYKHYLADLIATPFQVSGKVGLCTGL